MQRATKYEETIEERGGRGGGGCRIIQRCIIVLVTQVASHGRQKVDFRCCFVQVLDTIGRELYEQFLCQNLKLYIMLIGR